MHDAADHLPTGSAAVVREAGPNISGSSVPTQQQYQQQQPAASLPGPTLQHMSFRSCTAMLASAVMVPTDVGGSP